MAKSLRSPTPAGEWSGPTFQGRPGTDVIEDFKAHVREAGEPQTWKYHRHDAPARTAKPVLLDKFWLPEARLRNPELWAKCPLCAPNHAKYRWGYLTWFPKAEGGDDCIRAIGHDCGGRYFGDAEYKAALEVFRREQDEQAERKLLTEAMPKASSLQLWLASARPWAEAVQEFKNSLRRELPREFITQLVRASIGGGALTAQREIEVTFVRPDGRDGTRREGESYQVASVVGAGFLSEKPEDVLRLLQDATRLLRKLPKLEALAELDAASVSAASKAWHGAIENADLIFQSIKDAVAFADADNIAELQTWSRAPGSDAVAQILCLDRRPKISIYRYRKIGMPSMGMRPKVEVQIPDVLRQPQPEAPPGLR